MLFKPQFGHSASPEGRKQNSPWALALGRRHRQDRPERAAECRALFPKITFVKSDNQAGNGLWHRMQ